MVQFGYIFDKIKNFLPRYVPAGKYYIFVKFRGAQIKQERV